MFGLYKCPYDPLCVANAKESCTNCPNGANNEEECTDYAPWDWYAKCRNTTKYYHKRYNACDNGKSCTDGSDEEGCHDDQSCKVRTYGERNYTCPLDNVCIEKKDNFCTCPSGMNPLNTICSEELCRPLELNEYEVEEYGSDAKYTSCNTSNKCILSSQRCDGHEDCLNGEDEEGCTTEGCQKMGKFKCPVENKCIEERFLCDRDISYYSKHRKNKCEFNEDETNNACIEKCHRQGKFVCPSIEGPLNLYKHCVSANCKIDGDLRDKIPPELPANYFFQCSKNRSEFTLRNKTCDEIPDCKFNEDEYPLNPACDPFPIEIVIAITVATVMVLVCLMVGIKRTGVLPNAKKCQTCLTQYQQQISDEEWNQKNRLLSLLLGNNCCLEWGFMVSHHFDDLEEAYKEAEEWNRKPYLPVMLLDNNQSRTWGSLTKDHFTDLEEAYKQVHESSQKHDVHDIFQYATKRIETKFTFKNTIQAMNWRHEAICQPIYHLEMNLHNHDKLKTIRCLKHRLGTGAESYVILDSKDTPTIITQLAVYFNTLGRYFEFHKIIMPIINALSFIADVAKDIALTSYIGGRLYGSSSDELPSTEDYYLHGIHITSLFAGQIMISLFAFLNRYHAYSVCPHEKSTLSNFVLYTLTTVFFPLSGITMATESYFIQKECERDFDNISEKGSKKRLEKKDFEDLITNIKYTEDRSFGGFPTIKMLENVLESYYQLVLLLVMYTKLPHEGVLIVTFLPVSSFEILLLFIISSVATYLFIGTGILAFIVLKEKGSLGMKQKVVILLTYLIQTFICMLTTSLIFVIKSNTYHNLAFCIWLGITCFKLIFLSTYFMFGSKEKRPLVEHLMFVFANINLPVPLHQFDNSKTALFSGRYSVHGDYLFIWVLNIFENLLRVALILVSDANKTITKTFPLLTNETIWCIVLLGEICVVLLLVVLFTKVYMWCDLLTMPDPTKSTKTTQLIVKYYSPTDQADERCSIEFENETSKDRTPTQIMSEPPRLFKEACSGESEKSRIGKKRYSISNLCSSDEKCEAKDVGTCDVICSFMQEKLTSLKYQSLKKSCNSIKEELTSLTCPSFKTSLKTILLLLLVTLAVAVPYLIRPKPTTYQDCHEVRNKENGVYELMINNKPIVTYCKDGMTLIQMANPDVGNPSTYFNRPLKDYKEGFGFIQTQYWIGLDDLVELNQKYHTILRLELLDHREENQFWVEFDGFQIEKSVLDDITYSMACPVCFLTREQMDLYPITSLGHATSSFNRRGEFFLLWPSFVKSAEEKKEDREYPTGYGHYHDYLNAGFHTLDMEEDYECSSKYKNGWWFPHRVKLEKVWVDQLNQTGNCHFSPDRDTNLLGVYNKEEDKNQRQISFCEKEDCFVRGPPCYDGGATYCDSDWRGYYDFAGLTSIKLKKTQMWIGRKEKDKQDFLVK